MMERLKGARPKLLQMTADDADENQKKKTGKIVGKVERKQSKERWEKNERKKSCIEKKETKKSGLGKNSRYEEINKSIRLERNT